ncbi:MAG: cyclic nucleotide-binding protein, partial [Bradyrhizobium sp.]
RMSPASRVARLANSSRRRRAATALEYASVVRLSRSLFQRVLESDAVAARRLREEFANRATRLAGDILKAGAKLMS